MSNPLALEVSDSILLDDRAVAALRLVAGLELPEGAIAGDLVRCAVFDQIHGHAERTQLRRIEVVYFDAERTDAAIDRNIEMELVAASSRRPWEVQNLAALRPEAKNLAEALSVYADTASAVAARVTSRPGTPDALELVSPYGLEDLVAGVVRPHDPSRALELRQRAEKERWKARYPNLRFVGLDALEPDEG